MANLFFIHTPLQLLVAQQIIHQEKLNDNIMLYGYLKANFEDIYKLIVIDEMWTSCKYIENINDWASLYRKNAILDLRTLYRHYRSLKDFIRVNHVNRVFLSDWNNRSYQFTAFALKNIGCTISWLEDGSSHYMIVDTPFYFKGLRARCYGLLSDFLFFRPIFHFSWGPYAYYKSLDRKRIPMDARYSLRPFYHESFDKLIHFTPLISDKLTKYINEEIRGIDASKSVLVLTSPIYEVLGTKTSDIYLDTMRAFFRSVDKGSNIFIKFHPRESDQDKKSIIAMVEAQKLNYTILGRKINIPVECYLQYLRFDKIVSFFNSTLYYNGYLYPKTESIVLLDLLKEKCKEHHWYNTDLLDKIIDQYKKLKV